MVFLASAGLIVLGQYLRERRLRKEIREEMAAEIIAWLELNMPKKPTGLVQWMQEHGYDGDWREWTIQGLLSL